MTILFTAQSRFTLNSDSPRMVIWRERGTRYLPYNIREVNHYGGEGLMICAGIMLDGLTPLHVFEKCTVTAEKRGLGDLCSPFQGCCSL